MKSNIGKTDKIVRWIIGLTLLVLGILYKSWWGVIGLIPVVTALFGFCPLYSIIRITTSKDDNSLKE